MGVGGGVVLEVFCRILWPWNIHKVPSSKDSQGLLPGLADSRPSAVLSIAVIWKWIPQPSPVEDSLSDPSLLAWIFNIQDRYTNA